MATPPPDYGGAANATSTTSSGTTDIWGLPKDDSNTSIWYDTQNVPQSTQQVMGEHSGGGTYVQPASTMQVDMSAQQLMQQYAAMSQNDPGAYQSVQKLLFQAGYYGDTKYVYGTWSQTEAALARAVSDYIKITSGPNNSGSGAAVGVSFTQYLQNVAQQSAGNGTPGAPGAAAGGAGATPTPQVIALTDPDTLTRYAQMAAQNALGRSLKPNEISAFVNEFHQQQVNAGESKGLLREDKTGGVYGQVERGDARSAAVDYVTTAHPHEFAQHQIQGYTDAFLNMFLPNGSAAPNVQVDPQAVGY